MKFENCTVLHIGCRPIEGVELHAVENFMVRLRSEISRRQPMEPFAPLSRRLRRSSIANSDPNRRSNSSVASSPAAYCCRMVAPSSGRSYFMFLGSLDVPFCLPDPGALSCVRLRIVAGSLFPICVLFVAFLSMKRRGTPLHVKSSPARHRLDGRSTISQSVPRSGHSHAYWHPGTT